MASTGFITVALMAVGMSLVLFLLGFQSPGIALISSLGTDEAAAGLALEALSAIFTDPLFLSLVGIASVSTFFLLGGNSTITFIVPIFLAYVMINFFILPINFIFDAQFDVTLKIIFGLMLNSFIVLAIMEYVRG